MTMKQNPPTQEEMALLMGNEEVPVVEPPPEPDPEPEVLPKVPEVDPDPDLEPEVSDPEPEGEGKDPDPDPEPEVTPDEGSTEEATEYTQEEWDALPKEEREKVDAEWKASQESEEDRSTKFDEASAALKQNQLDFEKQKLDWEQKSAESKKEADKNYQSKMEMVRDAAEEAGVADEFKQRKAEARGKPAGTAEPMFPKYVPKQLVTQQEAKQQRLTQEQVSNLNDQRNATAKTSHDKIADHFNSQTEFIDEIKAERAVRKAFEKRATDWGETVKGLTEELGYEIFTAKGKYTPEANQIYDELDKVGVLEKDETTTEYRANMVRLIRRSLVTNPVAKPNGQQLKIPAVPKAPPGKSTSALPTRRAPRRRPPNTMAATGTGSGKAHEERSTDMNIVAGNK